MKSERSPTPVVPSTGGHWSVRPAGRRREPWSSIQTTSSPPPAPLPNRSPIDSTLSCCARTIYRHRRQHGVTRGCFPLICRIARSRLVVTSHRRDSWNYSIPIGIRPTRASVPRDPRNWSIHHQPRSNDLRLRPEVVTRRGRPLSSRCRALLRITHDGDRNPFALIAPARDSNPRPNARSTLHPMRAQRAGSAIVAPHRPSVAPVVRRSRRPEHRMLIRSTRSSRRRRELFAVPSCGDSRVRDSLRKSWNRESCVRSRPFWSSGRSSRLSPGKPKDQGSSPVGSLSLSGLVGVDTPRSERR